MADSIQGTPLYNVLEKTSISGSDKVFVNDGSDAKQITLDNLMSSSSLTSSKLNTTSKTIAGSINELKSSIPTGIGFNRNFYKEYSLGSGTSFAAAAASYLTYISNGTFTGIYPGAYVTINNNRYDVCDLDYWYLKGDTSLSTHHLVMIPHSSLYTAQMNTSNVTDGGYQGSAMYTDNLANALSQISTDFGTYLVTHREYLSNAVSNGSESGGSWVDNQIVLPNEIMIYGCNIRSSGFITIDRQQLAAARLNPYFFGRTAIWLRDVVSTSSFASVHDNGCASYYGASSARGIRPVFAVKGVA